MDYSKYSVFLRDNEGKAENTIRAYTRDLRIFEKFLMEKGIDDPNKATNTEVVAYLIRLKGQGKTESTANRRLVALRAYYDYAKAEGLVERNPTDGIKTPKIDRKDIEYLSEEEVVKFLEAPDDTTKGKRDKAIFELMYATGMRASEIVTAKLAEINLRMGFMMCDGEHGKARVIPIGSQAKRALEDYIENVRPRLLRRCDKDDNFLFVNYNGMPLSRQGLWKIFGEYGKKSGLQVRMTPKILRNSFAVHMLQNGADLKSLQDMLGHEDISATEVYLSATKNRIKDVYDKAHPRA